jgi:hypothetical protein
MKIWHTTALVIAVGLGLGFVATHGFAAQPKRAVYVVVEADEITDASRYEVAPHIGGKADMGERGILKSLWHPSATDHHVLAACSENI